MIIPPIGGLTGALGNAAGNLATGAPEALTSALGSTPAGASEGVGQAAAGAGGGTPSFGNELTGAISSLEEGQQSAAAASHALATGKVSDPEAAIATVEDASLEMQLAAQIRSKAAEAAQTIFQTQV